jgi:hypothetical protein
MHRAPVEFPDVTCVGGWRDRRDYHGGAGVTGGVLALPTAALAVGSLGLGRKTPLLLSGGGRDAAIAAIGIGRTTDTTRAGPSSGDAAAKNPPRKARIGGILAMFGNTASGTAETERRKACAAASRSSPTIRCSPQLPSRRCAASRVNLRRNSRCCQDRSGTELCTPRRLPVWRILPS